MDHPRRVKLEPLISDTQIRVRLEELVHEIARDTDDDELVVIGLLKGSFMFMADLVRLLFAHRVPLLLDFMVVSSYGSGTVSSGHVNMSRDVTTPIAGRKVLLVDDIIDTGRTLSVVFDHLKEQRPSSLRTCVFLDKPDRRIVPFEADYVGFTIPDQFVVGYGLDYDSRYRELPYLCIADFDEEDDAT
jgi:hypoxanthine phosphoribosyltransferase